MTEWTPDMVIYHHPCDDGFGAATVLARKYGLGLEFVGAKYGDAPPDVTGKNVLIVDFSYSADVLAQLGREARTVLILDHHETARDALEEYIIDDPQLNVQTLVNIDADPEVGTIPKRHCFFPYSPGHPYSNVVAIFDMERSGAGMVWDFFFPDEPRPHMVNLLEDRDLWVFKFEETNNFSMYLRSMPMDLLSWLELMTELEGEGWYDVIDRGIAIKSFFDRKIEEIVPQAQIVEIGGYEGVPVVNANWCFSSDVCHALLKAYPDAPFAASYFDTGDGKRQFSLRSEDHRVSVAEVAKGYGGGGHRNASGFSLPECFHLSSWKNVEDTV